MRQRAAGVRAAAAALGVTGLVAALAFITLRPATESEQPSGPAPSVAAPSVAAPPDDNLVIDHDVLMQLPTSGPAWQALVSAADRARGDVDLADQDSENAARTLAAALAFARTGDARYRDVVTAQLEKVQRASLRRADVLSVSRQLAGYVIAADVIGYRDERFEQLVSRIRTLTLGRHGRWLDLVGTSEDSGNNWGAWALASRIAASRYLGDTADVARAAQVFRGFLGDRASHVFRPTDDFDETWACGGRDGWAPVNAAGCGRRAGALVEDISRSRGRFPTVDEDGLAYSWEALGGATLSATLLSRGGYQDVYEWSDRALLRAARFLARNGGYPPPYRVNQYIPWTVNRAYDVELGPLNPAGAGRQYGFTDWLR